MAPVDDSEHPTFKAMIAPPPSIEEDSTMGHKQHTLKGGEVNIIGRGIL